MAMGNTPRPDLVEVARRLLVGPNVRRSMPAGYGMKPGERVLLVVNNFDDQAVVDAMIAAIRELPATVELIVLDFGPDRPLDELDELAGFVNWADSPTKKVYPWMLHPEWVE